MAQSLKLAFPADSLTTDQITFFSLLSRRIHLPIEPLPVATHAGLHAAFENGQASLVWAPPLVASDMISNERAIALAAIMRGARSFYPAVLVTRPDSRIEQLGDLENTRIAWVSKLSAAGYVVPRMFIESNSYDPSTFFAEEHFVYGHQQVLSAVQNGIVDVGATYARQCPKTGGLLLTDLNESLRIFTVTGVIPNDIVVAHQRLGEIDRMLVAYGLQRMAPHETALLGQDLAVERFSVRANDHLKPLLRLAQRARSANPLTGVDFPLWHTPPLARPTTSLLPSL